jgi:hypothetical protein
VRHAGRQLADGGHLLACTQLGGALFDDVLGLSLALRSAFSATRRSVTSRRVPMAPTILPFAQRRGGEVQPVAAGADVEEVFRLVGAGNQRGAIAVAR